MERSKSPEAKSPSNSLILHGRENLIVLAGETKQKSYERDWGEYGVCRVTEHACVLSGIGKIIKNGNPVLEFKIAPTKKVLGAIYDSHKPEHLSDIFERSDVSDQSAYVDELAAHMAALVHKANEEEKISTSSLDPVRVNHISGEATFNLMPFAESLEAHLQDKGIIVTPEQ